MVLDENHVVPIGIARSYRPAVHSPVGVVRGCLLLRDCTAGRDDVSPHAVQIRTADDEVAKALVLLAAS